MDGLTGWIIPGNSVRVSIGGKEVFSYQSGYENAEKKIKMREDHLYNVFSCSIVLILLASVVMGTVMMLGAFWSFGLDGIWLNMFGTSLLALGLGIILIRFVWKSVKR